MERQRSSLHSRERGLACPSRLTRSLLTLSATEEVTLHNKILRRTVTPVLLLVTLDEMKPSSSCLRELAPAYRIKAGNCISSTRTHSLLTASLQGSNMHQGLCCTYCCEVLCLIHGSSHHWTQIKSKQSFTANHSLTR